MAFSVAEALDRLKTREGALVVERRRIVETGKEELARVDTQLAAIRNVIAGLSDPTKAATVDILLSALATAGIRLEVGQ